MGSESCSVMSDSLLPHGLYTGVGSLTLQRIFPTQGSNPGLLHCRRILYQLSHQGSPRILEWVAYPFCSGSSRPRNQTGISCTAGKFFTNWAMREAPLCQWTHLYWVIEVINFFFYFQKLMLSFLSKPFCEIRDWYLLPYNITTVQKSRMGFRIP